jgi:hypothetical protein
MCRGSLVGDFEEVERLQAGIRRWLLRTARSGNHELRDIDAPAVLPLLCAAAFGPALADGLAPAAGVAGLGVLSSVGAGVLADLTRAAGEIQDSLTNQDAQLRAASEQVGRQSADVRMIREELAVIEQRPRQWLPEPADPRPRWTGGCPYRGLLPYDRDHEAVFYGQERLTAELAGKITGTPIVMVTGASGAGKTSLLHAGLVPALVRGVQVPGSSPWPVVSLSATARPLTALAVGLTSLGGRDPAAIRQTLADAPGEAHMLIREMLLAAGDPTRLVLIIDQFEQVFAADAPDERLERTAFIDAVCAAATQPAGLAGEPRPG